ncbi:insulin-like peptide INSL6 [Onychomys torridus]|uniref:insulin-like peptide INSL6 n=1 Tax=Onychomys torridus TaxID=38674 RepID=UPI00167F4B65|nr:insulin-like peptide INSL6 [Onychomys torridus]
MKHLSCSCLLWLGLLKATFSQGQEDSKLRKLCGSDLMTEIMKLCGRSSQRQMELNVKTALTQPSHKVSLDQIPSLSRGRFTNPTPASASTKTWEPQPLPDHQFEKANLLAEKSREFSALDVNPYVENVKLQKKSTNEINTFSSLFWGKHAQRKHKGFSDKCCLMGCTNEELAFACLPYADF